VENSYTRLHRSVVSRRVADKKRARERVGEIVFSLFLLGAMFWHGYGGLIMLNHSTHAARFYDGPIYLGLGALTYSVGWWLRFSLTGWRGIL
jgi:hypothetical protein